MIPTPIVSTIPTGARPLSSRFASTSLYVGDLSPDVTEATLFELFNAIGPVASIRVCRDSTTRRSLGYAYVNFHNVPDAERALDTMNFSNIRGRQCRIMWSQRNPRLRHSGKGNIFVKNLHGSIDNKTLYDTFSVFGSILSCKVVVHKDTGKSKGYGYVHYVDEKSGKKAIEGVNGMMISDCEVHAELFKTRKERFQELKYTNVYVKYIPREWTEAALKKVFEESTGGVVDKLFFWRHDYGVSACLNFIDSESAATAVEKLNGKDVSSLDLDPALLTSTEAPNADADAEDKQQAEDEEEKEEDSAAKKAATATATATQPTKLYVARAQKRNERKEYLKRKRSRAKTSRPGSSANLYVKNLSPDVDDTKLRQMFINFGGITSCVLQRDASGNSRGFGFVAFDKKECATRALHEMNNSLHHGKPLYVSRAQSKAFRQQFIRKQLLSRSRKKQAANVTNFPNAAIGAGVGHNMNMLPGGSRPGAPINYGPQFSGAAATAAAQSFGAAAGPYQPRPQFNIGSMLQAQPQPYNANNPALQPLQLQQLQELAAQQRQFQQQQAQQNAVALNPMGALPPSMASLQQQQQQAAVTGTASSVQQQPQQQSQPTQSIASGAQSSSLYRGLTASQQIHSSQPQQSSVSQSAQASAPMLDLNPLTAEMLNGAKPGERKRMIGERLFPKIQVVEPRLAGKITGMLLEMDNTELLVLLSDPRALMNKINEALGVLRDQHKSQQNPGSSKNQSASNLGSAQN
eukprot:CAMPEP_0202687704 /NCGR_PEP_ID=MMETSP1385-20130828/3355_1 /ASSEMBLY_ACC=CAM_ASM_000861 /TAXON_ID=933848 /ORGANISM="Elphidium margaritaceum" /LENGTH=746 /DNA_ID=CAMNT_0049342543 /DNA_START=42 /DNA_END=2282 /DNA_ORIENTATION=+